MPHSHLSGKDPGHAEARSWQISCERAACFREPFGPALRTIDRNRMELKEAIILALQSLWQNKLRTVLTLLGVMIGVASVIAVVTLVNGANTYVTSKFTRYGADVFTIFRFPALITN